MLSDSTFYALSVTCWQVTKPHCFLCCLLNSNTWMCSVQFFPIKPFLKHFGYVCFTSATPPFQSLFLTYILTESTVLLYFHRKHTMFRISIFSPQNLRWPHGHWVQTHSGLQRLQKVPLNIYSQITMPPKTHLFP